MFISQIGGSLAWNSESRCCMFDTSVRLRVKSFLARLCFLHLAPHFSTAVNKCFEYGFEDYLDTGYVYESDCQCFDEITGSQSGITL